MFKYFVIIVFGAVISAIMVCTLSSDVEAACETENNNSKNTANDIVFGEVISGVISDGTDVDWYRFKVVGNGYFTVSFGPDESVDPDHLAPAPNINICDNMGNIIKKYLYVRAEITTPYLTMEPGDYYIRIKDKYATGYNCSYKLAVNYYKDNSWALDKMKNDSNVKSIKAGKTAHGITINYKDKDVFRVKPGKKGRLRIDFKISKAADKDMVGGGYNIIISDKKKNELKHYYYVRGNRVFEVNYQGDVYITVSSFSGGAIDCPYSISVDKCEAPKTPKKFKVKLHEKGIMLSWKKVKNAKKYAIYRGISSKHSFKKIKTTRKTRWLDKKADSGWAHYYKVAAVSRKHKIEAESKYTKVKNVRREE